MNTRVIVTTQDVETEVTMSNTIEVLSLFSGLGQVGQVRFVRFVRDQDSQVFTLLLLIMINDNRNL